MANRIILTALISLALTLSPGLGQAVPTKGVKKKSSSKTQARVSQKSKSGRRAIYSRRRSRRRIQRLSASTPYRAEIVSSGPLIKVIPQRDGNFLLKPMVPSKRLTPMIEPSSRPEVKGEQISSSRHGYHRFEPWNFSELVMARAKAYEDTPYQMGSSLEYGNATDCSGFVQFIYHGFKIDLPRTSAEQAQVGKVVTRNMDFSKLLPGDLLFFSRGQRSVGHAGIYIGEGKMIHASSHRNGVTITNLRQAYYEENFVVARRVFEVKYR